MKTFTEYLELSSAQNKIVNSISDEFGQFSTDQYGLIPDNVRQTELYKDVRRRFYTEFKKLQDINRMGVKLYAKELREHHAEKRRQDISANNTISKQQ